MIAQAVISILHGSAPLNAIVNKRIRPNVIKVNEVIPAVYVLDYRMDKMGCDNDSGAMSGTIEVGIVSTDYNQCDKGMKAIRAALDDFTGQIGDIAIAVMSGEQQPDEFDERDGSHIKVIEYSAFAQNRS